MNKRDASTQKNEINVHGIKTPELNYDSRYGLDTRIELSVNK